MNTSVMPSTGLHRLIDGPYETIYEQVRTAVKAAGLEIVAEIDLAALLAKKSQSYMRPFKIVVVCDLDIVHRVLTVAPAVVTMLPCHVTVLQTPDDQVEVKITDPRIIWNTESAHYLKPIAEELNLRLERVIAALKG
jgi:uncharacterized protein (DUF302 family)